MLCWVCKVPAVPYLMSQAHFVASNVSGCPTSAWELSHPSYTQDSIFSGYVPWQPLNFWQGSPAALTCSIS